MIYFPIRGINILSMRRIHISLVEKISFFFLEDVVPHRIVDFLGKECSKDFVSHFFHIMGYGFQSEVSPQAEVVSRFEVDSQIEVSPQCEVECLEGSRNQK
jgi:hypothetical protein